MTLRRLLVANRGELVPRIARTCRSLGIRCLALVSEDQREAWWARQADERVGLEGGYLDADAVVAAARAAGADALHPGYGFLAESADFAEQVLGAGLAWVGPPPAAMRLLGDKAAARRLAAELGIPLLPGYDGHEQRDEVLEVEAERIGYPVLLKPSAGGGGKGMHVVRSSVEFAETVHRARREARTAFADERLILERYVDRPRHVEIQILVDGHGAAVHLGERDCTLQRRHQKVVEESPSPSVDTALRSRLGGYALRLALAGGYVGAGTVEFLLDDEAKPYFLEVNARLQVEHPVTELVTRRDLVADQLRIASGEPLRLAQPEVTLEGHAVEARLYAEDPWADFLPATGLVRRVAWPAGEGLRVDAGVGEGDQVGTRYDPLVAKILAFGDDRREALARLAAALRATRVEGVTTNRGFLAALLELPEVVEGDHRTDTIALRWQPDATEPLAEAWGTAAAALAARLDSAGSPVAGFRLNAPPRLRLRIGDEERAVTVPDGPPPGAGWWPLEGDDAAHSVVTVDVDGRAVEVRLAPPPTVESAVRHASPGGPVARVEAPMPGTVIDVRVVEGARVEAHQPLVVLEAMKMENPVTAPADGRVERVLVKPGQSVQRGEPLVELA